MYIYMYTYLFQFNPPTIINEQGIHKDNPAPQVKWIHQTSVFLIQSINHS